MISNPESHLTLSPDWIQSDSIRSTLKKNKGGLQNPPKRFSRFLKGSKCVQSLKKRIKNSTEPFEGSAFYSIAEPPLTEPFLRFCTAKKMFREKVRGSVQDH